MADPLSITASVVTLIQVSVQVTLLLKQFRDESNNVDATLTSLLTDVEGFQQVLESMQETFEQDEIKATLQSTGHVGNHWKNLARSLNDGKATLKSLHGLLDKINKSRRFLDAPRKIFRLKSVGDQIVMFREQIQSYRGALQLSLSTVILWNQITFQHSTEAIPDRILPSLDKLYDGFRDLGIMLNARIEKLQAAVSQSNQQEINSMNNLRECVHAAADVASSASTALATEINDDSSVRHGSDLGDILPAKGTQTIVEWMQSNPLYEDASAKNSSLPPGSSTNETATECSSDSDSDIEGDMLKALYRAGMTRRRTGDLRGALRCFENCLNRIPPREGTASPQRVSPGGIARLDVLEHILAIHSVEKSWSSTKPVISDMLQIIERQKGTRNEGFLHTNLKFAGILMRNEEYVAAHLQARRSLRGFKRLGETGDSGYRESLQLLIRLCQLEGNADEEEGYVALLTQHMEEFQEPLAAAGDHKEKESCGDVGDVKLGSSPTRSATVNISSHSQELHEDSESERLRETVAEDSSIRKGSETTIDNGGDHNLNKERKHKSIPLRSRSPSIDSTPSDNEVTRLATALQTDLIEGIEPASSQEQRFPAPAKQDSITRLSMFPNSQDTALPSKSPSELNSASHSVDVEASEEKLPIVQISATLPRSEFNDCYGCRMNLRERSKEYAKCHIARCMEATRNYHDPAMRVQSDLEVAARKKILLVGESSCGKTWLAMTWAMGRRPRSAVTTPEFPVFNNFIKDIVIDGLLVELLVRESSVEKGFEDLRYLSYMDVDLVLLCFELSQKDSKPRFKSAWSIDTNAYLWEVPRILVGCKRDLLDTRNQSIFREYDQFMWRFFFDAEAYFETSAVDGTGLQELFEFAARTTLRQELRSRERTLTGLPICRWHGHDW